MSPNIPQGRQKRVTSGGQGVSRRGSGTGMGKVGSGSALGSGAGLGGSSGHSNYSGGGRPSGGGGMRFPGRRGGGAGLIFIVIVVLYFLLHSGGIGSLLGGGSSDGGYSSYDTSSSATSGSSAVSTLTDLAGSLLGGGLTSSSSMSSYMGGYGTTADTAGWYGGSDNRGQLDTTVSSQARSKYTTIKSDGTDQVTVMVYMCGTDLESKNGMASNDLAEMASATLSDRVNIIVYTGGCKAWKTSGISNSVNQIYRIKSGGMECLVPDAGSGAMTDPNTLVDFLSFCQEHFPANRNMLIFWDHGGGSVSGYGYDEKNASAGSMNLAGINSALKNVGMTFDFIGFDACLMATVETDLMASKYADYLIASEETEPGIGWYYTNWLTELSADPGKSTLEIGKRITDDFVDTCASRCPGQKTTLSVVDLSELGETLSDDFKAFAGGLSDMIKQDDYSTVSTARSDVRDFATSYKIDQIDLVHFAKSVGTKEGEALAKTLLSAVKYNRTSSNMTNANGISIYFPYRRTSYVDKAVKTYDQIGLDDEYGECIREFASVECSGQAATGGSTSAFSLLSGGGYGSGTQSLDAVTSLLSAFMSNRSVISGLDAGNTSFLTQSGYSQEAIASYVSEHQFDITSLTWQSDDLGYYVYVSPDQWKLVDDIALDAFYDDGEGYIDLGLDTIFSVDENGRMYSGADGTWISINNQPVAFYYIDTIYSAEDKYAITGRVPALLNGERVDLILVFDDENPYGYVSGASTAYVKGETDTVAKGLIPVNDGDVIDFLCDYYTYDGTFTDSYFLGNQLTVNGELFISNTEVDADRMIQLYRFTDIFNQHYWTKPVPGFETN